MPVCKGGNYNLGVEDRQGERTKEFEAMSAYVLYDGAMGRSSSLRLSNTA